MNAEKTKKFYYRFYLAMLLDAKNMPLYLTIHSQNILQKRETLKLLSKRLFLTLFMKCDIMINAHGSTENS